MGRGTTNSYVRMMREQERTVAREMREAERHARDELRRIEQQIKLDQKMYVEQRAADVAEKNSEIEGIVDNLNCLLVGGIKANPRIDFLSYYKTASILPLCLGELGKPFIPPQLNIPSKPGFFASLLPGAGSRYKALVDDEESKYQTALAEYKRRETEREKQVRKRQESYQEKQAEEKALVDTHNADVDKFKEQFQAQEPDAIVEYFETVLGSGDYLDGFPQTAKLAYITESKQLVVEYDLPEMKNIVPEVKSYKYVKSTDTVTETPRPEAQRRNLYSSVVAQTTLLSIWQIFEADVHNFIETVAFNGYVTTINPGTGKEIRPCLVTVRTSKDAFAGLDLRHVEATACLRTLNASFSKSPGELAPVRPILELNMVDPRFIQETDVLSTLDQRQNLMDLTPSDFESLITNLFQKMGLDTKLTQASRDGGVDCVAFDPRPIFGGKVVVQAKRYKNTVGVSAVRDLFGTMQNEGASKGILVTTSGYGKAAFDFANGKPIELLDGGNLLFLLKEHCDIEVKIVMPEDWKEVSIDNGI